MGDGRSERRAPHRPHSTLTSAQTPRFTSQERSPQLELFGISSPPSQPVEVNEDWVQSFRTRLSGLQQTPVDQLSSPVSSPFFDSSGHISRLGDSSSLFSFTSPSEEDNSGKSGAAKQRSFEFEDLSPLRHQDFTFTSPLSSRLDSRQSAVEPLFPKINKPRNPDLASKMVVEREPPKAPASPHKTTQQPIQRVQQPEFGKSSPLRNPFHS
ncbi:MAG: hypothetical protein M1830_002687, partial [Pleopsidium flavum]